MSHVFLSQLEGEKEVWLFAPDQSALLYKLPFNFHGVINLRDPDYRNYPGVQYLQGLKCTLKKGDTLYIPAGYWHYIQYTTGGYSVSYRSLPASFFQKLIGFRNIFITRKFDNLMRRILKEKWFYYKLERSHTIAARTINQLS